MKRKFVRVCVCGGRLAPRAQRKKGRGKINMQAARQQKGGEKDEKERESLKVGKSQRTRRMRFNRVEMGGSREMWHKLQECALTHPIKSHFN